MHRAPLLVVGTPRDAKYWCRYNNIKMDWVRLVRGLEDMRGYATGTSIHFVGDWVRLSGAADIVKFAQYMDFDMNGEKLNHAPTQASGPMVTLSNGALYTIPPSDTYNLRP